MSEKDKGSGRIGKTYPGEKHVPVRTPEGIQEEMDRQAQFAGKPDTMPFLAWCQLRGHRDPVLQASMQAYDPARGVKVATAEDWDAIFEKFF